MFHYDRGLWLSRAELAVDIPRRQKQGFISHAHADHAARHELALCTPATAALYQHRYGKRPVKPMPFREPLDWGGLRLTTFPAGHCLGSAMLLSEDDQQSLLYTGDFKLGESLTAQRAEPPHADLLVMECTFGDPRYRLPPRGEVIGKLLEIVHAAFDRGLPPVIQAYQLGKGQEVTKILTAAGVPVLQHPVMYQISEVYQQQGVDLGNVAAYGEHYIPGHAVVTVPPRQRARRLPDLDSAVTIAVTGWAQDEGAKYRLRVNHALSLSDHADYDELLEVIERVEPKEIHCTHGPAKFVDRLQDLGLNAFPLGRGHQMRLF